ncbi:MAG: hypothetical protein V1743_03250 [Nanoarchaeota archaeon]
MTYQRRTRGLVKAACIGTLAASLAACNPGIARKTEIRPQDTRTIESVMETPFSWDYMITDNKLFISLLQDYIQFLENYQNDQHFSTQRSTYPIDQNSNGGPERTQEQLFKEEKDILNFLEQHDQLQTYIAIEDTTQHFYAMDKERVITYISRRILWDRFHPDKTPFDLFLTGFIDMYMPLSTRKDSPR